MITTYDDLQLILLIVGFNLVLKLPTKEFLKNIKYTMARNTKNTRIFSLRKRDYQIYFSLFSFQCSNIDIHMLKNS